MSIETLKEPMISDSCDSKAFMKAMEQKTLLEVVAFADREALAAWRLARQGSKADKKSGDCPVHYKQTIEELAAFLKATVTYRPSNTQQDVFEQFLRIRRKVGSPPNGFSRR